MKITVLYSGGLDSYCMYHKAKLDHPEAEVQAIYFNHGQPVAQKEIAGLPSFVEVRNIDWLNTEKLPVAQEGRREGAIMIPGRNLVFGTLIACQELPDEIWIGALKGETHAKGTDKNYTFLEHMNTTINYVLKPFKYPITAKFPLADAGLNKLDEVKWALANGLTKEDLLSTRSCHDGETDACGQCVQCIKRWAVFGQNGFSEKYDTHPLNGEYGKQYIYDLVNCELGNDDYYDAETREEIISFIKSEYIKTPHRFEQRTANLLNQLG